MEKDKQKKAPQQAFPGFVEEKSQMRSIIIGIAFSVLTVFALYLIGMFLSNIFSASAVFLVLIFCLIIVALLTIFALVNYFGEKQFSKKQQNKSLELHNKEFNERRVSAAEHLKETVRKIEKLRVLITLYILSLNIFAILLSIGLGVLKFPYLLVLPAFIFCRIFCMLNYNKKVDVFEGYSSPSKFPIIHSLAEKAMKASGIKGKVRIIFIGNNNIGILRIKRNSYSLQVGVTLLDLLTEDELYQIFLHEFAHVTKSCYPTDAGFRLNASFLPRGGKYFKLFRAFNLFLRLPAAFFNYEFSLFRASSSTGIESIADAATLKYGNPKIATTALIKLNYISCFYEEINIHIKEPLYAPETPRENFSTIVRDAFRSVFPNRREQWDHFALVEIQPRNASHPIIRERLRIIGLEYTPITELPERTGSLMRDECEKAIEESNIAFVKQIKDNYDDIRKQNYLEHIEIVSEWEQNGKPVNCTEDRAVIEALDALFRREEAEEHCDRVINESESIYCTAFARFRKGLYLVERYDTSAITLLYESIDINKNYTAPALDAIGKLCCKLGMQTELDEYRSRSIEMMQKLQNEQPGTNTLNPNDEMSQDNDLPDEEKKAILDYLIKVNDSKIKRIYLIRKKVNETLSTSAYVLEFKPEIEEKDRYPIMKKAFYLLDNRPIDWQFSLFQYEVVTAAVKKMSHTCIYTFED